MWKPSNSEALQKEMSGTTIQFPQDILTQIFSYLAGLKYQMYSNINYAGELNLVFILWSMPYLFAHSVYPRVSPYI